MAITITSQLTDVSLNPGSPTSLGTGDAPASETVINLEGTNCAAIGHAGTAGSASPTIANMRGMYTTVTGFTRTDMHIHIWIRDLYPVRTKALNGVSVYVFGGGNAALYGFEGFDTGYAGGWYHAVLNLDPTTRPAADIGTAPGGNITRIGYEGNLSADKGEAFLQNCYFDAIRRGTHAQGISFYGGTTGARHTLKDCADADTSYYGLLRSVGGALTVEGPLTFGVATQTTYIEDVLKTLAFTNFTTAGDAPSIAADYYHIVLADGTTGVTYVKWTDITLKGVSRAVPFTFDCLLASGDSFVSLRTTFIFGDVITLCGFGSSKQDRFIECAEIILNGAFMEEPNFTNCDAVDLTGGNDYIYLGSTVGHNTAINVPFITTDDLTKIEEHSFNNTGGVGHAIEITTTGTYNMYAVMYSGYGLDASSSAMIYNNSGGLVTINISNRGTVPTIRNGVGASTVVNNLVPVTVFVDDENGNALNGVRILIEADTGGPLPVGTEILTGLTSGVGRLSTNHNYTTAQPVKGWARKSTTTPFYKEYPLIGVISIHIGLVFNIQMILDE